MASKLVLVVVFILDLIAFGLAVAAEQRRSTAIIVEDRASKQSYCSYKSDNATGLGAASFFFLLASQVLVMVVSRCFCCGRPLSPGHSRAWAIFLFITCWVAFFIAEVCLLAGSVRNAYHTKYRALISEKSLSCETLRKGVFGAGAAFIIFTAILSEFYYVCYAKAKAFSKPPYGREAGIGMSTYR